MYVGLVLLNVQRGREKDRQKIYCVDSLQIKYCLVIYATGIRRGTDKWSDIII